MNMLTMNEFDYNKQGQEYNYHAMAGEPLGLGFLPEEGVRTLAFATELIHNASKDVDAKNTPLAPLHCAFERLEGLLLIGKRITDAIQSIPAQLVEPSRQAPCLVVVPNTTIFIDCASLLDHAGSTLDILSRYYTEESGVGTKDSKFRGSKDRIYNLQPPDIRADYLWNDLDRFEQQIGSIFTSQDGFKGLRNYIAHENSVLGLSKYVFSAHCFQINRALVFDCEIEVTNKQSGQSRLFPISRTTETVISLVTWIACRVVLCYLTRTRQGAISFNPSSVHGWGPDKFVPVWTNPLTVFSSYISTDTSHQVFSVIRAGWNGFQTHNKPLRPDVLNEAIHIPEH